MAINDKPIAASRGRVNIELNTSAIEKRKKTAGTTGYPQTLYGRGSFGSLILNTITPSAVAP